MTFFCVQTIRKPRFFFRKHVNQGQVSTEFLFSILILLLLFVVVLLFIEQIRQSSAVTHQNVEEQEVCTKLSSIITYMSSNPPYTETYFELLRDTNVVNGNIFVGDIFCPFLGKAQNVQLYPGVVKAFDVNGVVIFTNDLNYSPLNPPSGPPSVGSNIPGSIALLIDDQNQTWIAEVQADDVSYAISSDNASVDPDFVEFRFSSLGLTEANLITDVRVLINHFESSHLGLNSAKREVQCYDGSDWNVFDSYTPSFTELYYQSPNLATCVSDWNKANNARVRMTYEPNGSNGTISIDYGRIDVNFVQIGYVIDLWEHAADLPHPLDFRTDINSTANTFGPLLGNDGWDWNTLVYGGNLTASVQFNADPDADGNISDSNVWNAGRIEIKLGGNLLGSPIDPDDNATMGPVTSGAYGIQFDVNNQLYAAVQGGSKVLLSFNYVIDADAGWGNQLDAGEEGWFKIRFGGPDTNVMTYLGSDLDGNDNDADPTNEIWWADQPVDATGFFMQDVASLVTGAGVYYFDIGIALSDWDARREGLGLYLDNINLVVV